MGLRDAWQRWQTQRATKYLQGHQHLALECLRRDPALGAQAFQAFLQMQAATEGPDRRSYAYPLFQSFGLGAQSPLARVVAKPLSWQIRSFSEYPPARRAINALCNPILDLPFTITVRRPLDLDLYEVEPPATADQQRRILAVTALLERPNNELAGREFLELLLEDLVCLGACPFEVEPNTTDDRPLFLWPVECETIRMNVRWRPGSDTFRYSQSRAYAFGSSAGTDAVEFTEEQMCYPRLNPRVHTPFGLGYLEVALSAINAFAGAFDFATRKASNATPSHALFLGENLTVDQTRMWQHYWENEVEGMGKMPILGGGRAPTVLSMLGAGDDPLQIQWQEWVTRVIAMSFGLSPMKLGIERDVNRSTAETQSSDDWDTVAPIANTLRTCYNHWLLRKRLQWPDLEFQWKVKDADELKQAEILALQYEANDITVNELREMYERPPLEGGLGDLTKTQFETAVQTMAAQALQAQTQQHEATMAEYAQQHQTTLAERDQEYETTLAQQPPPRARRRDQAARGMVTPFFDLGEGALSPREREFVRQLMKQSRRRRNGHAGMVRERG